MEKTQSFDKQYDNLEEQTIPVQPRNLKGTATRTNFFIFVFLIVFLFKKTQHNTQSKNTINDTASDEFKWSPCDENNNFQCGFLQVPKDYLNISVGHSTLAMIKVPSTCKASDRLGSMFLNFGGPSGSGLSGVLRMGSNLSALFEGRYDLISFDPRGVGKTTPLVSCFKNGLEYELFKAGSVLEKGFDISRSPDPFSTEGTSHLLEQHRELLAMQLTEFTKCSEVMGDELRYMGTTTVVRDIEEMSRVLEGAEAKINYLGFSYGTILGAFLVNMIPEKIGKVIIDGVASAPQWANRHTYEWLHEWMVDTESAFEWFLRDCHEAGPKNCPLARTSDEGPSSIALRLEIFLDELYNYPLAVAHGDRAGILTSGGARALLYAATNRPMSWPLISKLFDQAMSEGNPTGLYNQLIRPFHFDSNFKIQGDLSRAAVSCIDSLSFESEEDWPTAEFMVANTLSVLRDTSKHFGASVTLLEPDGGCQFWSAISSPERFTGPWNSTLETQMLIVSNTNDPITPLASGREINKLMSNSSKLLIQNSPGHCSLSSFSTCTMKYYRDYFVNGILPGNEVVCEIDHGYFPVEGVLVEKVWEGETKEMKDLREVSKGLSGDWNDWIMDR